MQKILILGAKGMVGHQLMKAFGSGAVGWDRSGVDVTEFESLNFKVEHLKPSAIINCVAYNDVDGAEDNKELAFNLNAEVVGRLAEISKKLDIPLVHFSTNYVFDGQKGEYEESDLPNPQSVYGKSKYAGELELQKKAGKFYLIRTSVLFGPKGQSAASKPSFAELMLDLSQKSDRIKAVSDEINSITYVCDLAQAVKNLLASAVPYGVYHITNRGSASWYDYAKEIFSITGKTINLIPVTAEDFSRKAIRPKKAVLLNTRLPQLRTWQSALAEFLNQKS